MPTYKDDVKEKAPEPVIEETVKVSELLEYTKERWNPFRNEFIKTVKQCYDFKERRQWDGLEDLLKVYEVPPIPCDRINRSLDTIDGIRANTRSKKKIIKRESGDDRIAEILDKVYDFVSYQGNFDLVADDSFDSLKVAGVGIQKIGFDQSLSGGMGDIWVENVNPEDCGWSYTRKKDWSDVRWVWQQISMDWEAAMRLNPNKAPQLKSLRVTLEKKWDEVKAQTNARDYGVEQSIPEVRHGYPDQVLITEIWIKRIIPYKKVAFVTNVPIGTDGFNVLHAPIKSVKKVPIEYEIQDGEQDAGSSIDEQWYQHIIASSKNKEGGILLTPIDGIPFEFPFHPFVPQIAEYSKSGKPIGFVEGVIPHQQRINTAWAQKMAFNNKSIKSPLFLSGTGWDMSNVIQQTSVGAIFMIPTGGKVENVNTVPNVDLQAIEEGNIAREDMDFSAAASEPVLRGMSDPGSSGIKLAQQQSAAVTPLNKWVKSENESKLNLVRKALHIIIKKYSVERLARIVGLQRFQQLMIGDLDPMTGIPLNPPLQFPISIDTAEYDVIIQEESISDMEKQQSFNASMALHQSGFPMDGEYMIMNAPVKNPEEAYASYLKARQDIIMALQAQIQMLEAQLQQTEKLVPKEDRPMGMGKGRSGGQMANGIKGKNQPQAGMKSMLGGQLYQNK